MFAEVLNCPVHVLYFFIFIDTATTEIYTLSLHDALPISREARLGGVDPALERERARHGGHHRDRKSTRLNSSHTVISYDVFCLKKKTTVPLCELAVGSAPLALIAFRYHSKLLMKSSTFFFFFNDTATTKIYTLSLHDALPILILPLNVLNKGLKTFARNPQSCWSIV